MIFLIFNLSDKGFAETYSCSYLFDGKSSPYVLYREGNAFRDQQGEKFQIIFENAEVIHLYNRIDISYFATFLFKTNKVFKFTALDPEYDTVTLKGDCVVF